MVKSKMDLSKLFIAFILIFVSASVFAQSTKDEVTYMQSLWGMEKREIVKKHMALSENEAANFWTAYDKYEDTRKELGRERISTVDDYTKNIANLTDAKADELALRILSNQAKFVDLMNSAYTDMKAVVSQTKALQFIQLEMYLDTGLKLKVMEQLPFVGEIK